MLFSLCYNLAIGLFALFALPKAILNGKLQRISERMFWGFPKIEQDDNDLIWIHAVSFGEMKAVTPLVPKLKAEYTKKHGKTPLVVISTVTATGYAEAKEALPDADHHVYLPLDFSWNVNLCLRGVKPNLVVLTETDLWYHFLKHCNSAGSRIAVVNAKLSEKTCSRFKQLPWLAQRLYGLVDRFAVQEEVYSERLQAIGVAPERLDVTGNIKFDAKVPFLSEQGSTELRTRMGLQSGDRVVTVGSSHDPEERQLLKALTPLWEREPRLKIVLVPRHPQRFDAVAALLKERDIPFWRFSSEQPATGDEKVLLVDAMGVLRQCYELADISIVAGSFTDKVGGHNILEPCPYGSAVLFGPHMHTQPQMVRLALESGAGQQVTYSEVAGAVSTLLSDQSALDSQGQRCKDLWSTLGGAIERSVRSVL